MSRISKILLIASAALFFLALHIHQYNEQNKIIEMDEADLGWAWAVALLSATGYGALDVIVMTMIPAAFACIFLAILHWKRDRPHQNLFPE